MTKNNGIKLYQFVAKKNEINLEPFLNKWFFYAFIFFDNLRDYVCFYWCNEVLI